MSELDACVISLVPDAAVMLLNSRHGQPFSSHPPNVIQTLEALQKSTGGRVGIWKSIVKECLRNSFKLF
jgi:hypothetical protein